MSHPNQIEPSDKQPKWTDKKSRLEESSIFASRSSNTKKDDFKSAKPAGRKWPGMVALLIVLGVALFLGWNSLGTGFADASGLSGFAGGAAEEATSTSTETPEPTATFTPSATFTPTFTSTPSLGIGSSLIRLSDGMVMMYIPAGEFTMGVNMEEAAAECAKTRGECESIWFSDESPPHLVTLDAYWMDQIEVTNAMYVLCVNAGVCAPPRLTGSELVEEYYDNPAYADYPVVYIPWKQADNYCRWAGGRLPTEAEWEKAARGTDGRIFPWGNARPSCSLSNYNPFFGGLCSGDVSAARSYPEGQSPYQILNMAGNVAEWVLDWYDPNYYSISPYSNPQGPADGLAKILRGGSWYFDEDFVRTTYRYKQDARYYYSFTGFRCVVPE